MLQSFCYHSSGDNIVLWSLLMCIVFSAHFLPYLFLGVFDSKNVEWSRFVISQLIKEMEVMEAH
jgi:hypothetical protein